MSIGQAVALFSKFHRRKPQRGELAKVGMRASADALVVGELVGVIYKTKGKKRPFVHRFKRRPKLMVSADGNQTFVIGKTRFTPRGFIS